MKQAYKVGDSVTVGAWLTGEPIQGTIAEADGKDYLIEYKDSTVSRGVNSVWLRYGEFSTAIRQVNR